MKKLRRPAVAVLLTIASVSAGFIFAEIVIRIAAPLLSPAMRAVIREEGYQGAQSALRAARGNTLVLREVDFGKRQDIVVVGDSMVFGSLVKEEDLFTTRLSRDLQLSVLNLGIGSTGPNVYNHMLQMSLSRLPAPPSVVFYIIAVNDLTDGPPRSLPSSGLYTWDTTPKTLGLRLRLAREWLLQYSVFYQLFKRMVTFGHLRQGPAYTPIHYRGGGIELLFAPPSYWKPYLDLTVPTLRVGLEQTMTKIEIGWTLTERAGSRFMLVLMPSKEHVYLPDLVARRALPPETYPAFYDQTYDELLRQAKERGITTLDLRAEFREASRKGGKLHWTLDAHQTPEGHEMTAKALETVLRTELPRKN